MIATIPCDFCGHRLALDIRTDGNGGTVEHAERCRCPDARKARHECVDCGALLRRKNPRHRWPERCPEHRRRRRNRIAREHQRQVYWRDPEKKRARSRRDHQRIREQPARHEALKAEFRRRHREEALIRRGRLGRCPQEVIHLRDRLAYRLRVNEGFSAAEVGEVLGIGRSWASQIIKDQREWRERMQEARAA